MIVGRRVLAGFGLLLLLVLARPSLASDTPEGLRPIEVRLNGKHLLWAHTHAPANDPRAVVDQTSVSHTEVIDLVGGSKYVVRRGSNLDAVAVSGVERAPLRVVRKGRISSRVHRMGEGAYIPLADLAKALRASITPAPDRIDLDSARRWDGQARRAILGVPGLLEGSAPREPLRPAGAPESECESDSDCWLVASYCGGCSCLALARGQRAQPCREPVRCLEDPCSGRIAVCDHETRLCTAANP